MAKTNKPFILVEKDTEDLYKSYKKRGYTLDILEDKYFEEYKKARQAVKRAKNKYPNRLFVVQYRELMEKYNEVLSNLFSFLGIHFDAKSADLDNFFAKTDLPEDVHQDDVGGFGRVPKNKTVEISEEEKEKLHRLATLAEEQEEYVAPEEQHDSALQDNTTTGVTESTEASDTRSKRKKAANKIRKMFNKSAPLESTMSSTSSKGRKRDKVVRFANSAKNKVRSAVSRKKKEKGEESTISTQVASEPVYRQESSQKTSHVSEAVPDESDDDNDEVEQEMDKDVQQDTVEEVHQTVAENVKKVANKQESKLIIAGYPLKTVRRETRKHLKDLKVLHITKANAKIIANNISEGKKAFEGLGNPEAITGIDNLCRLSRSKANKYAQHLSDAYPEAVFLVNEKSESPIVKSLLCRVREDAFMGDKRAKLASSLKRIRDSII
jgi:hypothetical protein